DDHALFRSGIASLLSEFNDIEIVFEAANGVDLQKKLEQHSDVDVILMDINMPLMDGYAATEWLKQKYPAILVLALSMYDEEQAIIKMLKAGASGYILKEAQVAELHQAIFELMEKGFYTNDMISGNMMRSLQQKEVDLKQTLKLSDKEILFLELCASELTYKEMADQLGIAVRSVDNYSRSLFEKTGARSRVGLVLWAIRNHLIDPH
ncbi:MAG: response regulator transcription factor, partial [Sediminibacterium sp.]|nr:response regulator transcription factor [Sediminibacterium sp.]